MNEDTVEQETMFPEILKTDVFNGSTSESVNTGLKGVFWLQCGGCGQSVVPRDIIDKDTCILCQ